MDIKEDMEYINSIFPTVRSTHETFCMSKVTPKLITSMRTVIDELELQLATKK